MSAIENTLNDSYRIEPNDKKNMLKKTNGLDEMNWKKLCVFPSFFFIRSLFFCRAFFSSGSDSTVVFQVFFLQQTQFFTHPTTWNSEILNSSIHLPHTIYDSADNPYRWYWRRFSGTKNQSFTTVFRLQIEKSHVLRYANRIKSTELQEKPKYRRFYSQALEYDWWFRLHRYIYNK